MSVLHYCIMLALNLNTHLQRNLYLPTVFISTIGFTLQLFCGDEVNGIRGPSAANMSLVSLKWEEVKKSYIEYLTTNVDLVTSVSVN